MKGFELWQISFTDARRGCRHIDDVASIAEGKQVAIGRGDGTYVLCNQTGNVVRIDVAGGKALVREDDALEDGEDGRLLGGVSPKRPPPFRGTDDGQ